MVSWRKSWVSFGGGMPKRKTPHKSSWRSSKSRHKIMKTYVFAERR
jgi:hypothetical protein